jgi:hypothetical protein
LSPNSKSRGSKQKHELQQAPYLGTNYRGHPNPPFGPFSCGFGREPRLAVSSVSPPARAHRLPWPGARAPRTTCQIEPQIRRRHRYLCNRPEAELPPPPAPLRPAEGRAPSAAASAAGWRSSSFRSERRDRLEVELPPPPPLAATGEVRGRRSRGHGRALRPHWL